MSKENIYRKWHKYLDGDYDVIMDNDQWWFVHKDDPEQEWINVGGEGPYGRDLLEAILDRLGMEVIPV